jgi:hypothetical protein
MPDVAPRAERIDDGERIRRVALTEVGESAA